MDTAIRGHSAPAAERRCCRRLLLATQRRGHTDASALTSPERPMCTCGCDPVAAVGQPCCGCGCCSGKDDQAQRVCARSWDKFLCGADFNQVLRAQEACGCNAVDGLARSWVGSCDAAPRKGGCGKAARSFHVWWLEVQSDFFALCLTVDNRNRNVTSADMLTISARDVPLEGSNTTATIGNFERPSFGYLDVHSGSKPLTRLALRCTQPAHRPTSLPLRRHTRLVSAAHHHACFNPVIWSSPACKPCPT